MAQVSNKLRQKNVAYLAGYFALLLITISGLALQGGANYIFEAIGIAFILGATTFYVKRVFGKHKK